MEDDEEEDVAKLDQEDADEEEEGEEEMEDQYLEVESELSPEELEFRRLEAIEEEERQMRLEGGSLGFLSRIGT